MSISWRWNDKMGEVVYDYDMRGVKCNLYKGNAQMIAIDEHPNGTYSLSWLSADKTDLRNKLGLTKGCNENCFEDLHIRRIRLNTKYKEVPQIISDFAKAKLNIEIELYYE